MTFSVTARQRSNIIVLVYSLKYALSLPLFHFSIARVYAIGCLHISTFASISSDSGNIGLCSACISLWSIMVQLQHMQRVPASHISVPCLCLISLLTLAHVHVHVHVITCVCLYMWFCMIVLVVM